MIHIARIVRKSIGDEILFARQPRHIERVWEKLFPESEDPQVGNFSKWLLEYANQWPMIGLDREVAATLQEVLAFLDRPLNSQALEFDGGVVGFGWL